MTKSGERIRHFIENRDPYGQITTLDQWQRMFGKHWNDAAELHSLAHIEKIELAKRKTVNVPLKGTISQLYNVQTLVRRGRTLTIARDIKTGRFVKRTV